MSENNYGALMMKSGISADIDIDSLLQPGIYTIRQGNESSPDINGGVLTVLSDPEKRRTFTSNAIVFAVATYKESSKSWGDWSFSLPMNDISAPSGFGFIGQFSSVYKLSLYRGAHGDRVLVKSYNEGGSDGGGQFVYDEDRASENDGVTVFNGWVRQIINNTLTNFDAGIIPFDGSDATQKLQNLYNSVPDGTTVIVMGYHQVSGPVTIKNKSNLNLIFQNGTLSGRERKSTWRWGSDPDFEYGSGNLGLLSLFNCPFTTIEGLSATGSHLQRPDSKEWGDCMIRYEYCPHMTIRNCRGEYFGGWGIFGMYSDHSEASNVNISHVSRQSGINIFACSSYCKVHHCTVIDVGLYGVEFETFDSKSNSITYGNEASNNTIHYAKFGICAVGTHNDAVITANHTYWCETGIFAIKTYGSLSVNENIHLNCMRGIQVNSSRNVMVAHNNHNIDTIPTFVIHDQYNAVLDITADRMAFYSINSVRAGYQIQIRGVTYTVASSVQDSTRTDYQAQDGGLYLNALTTALTADVEHCDNVYTSTASLSITPYGYGMNAEASASDVINSTSNVHFDANSTSGFIAAGLFSNSQYSDFSTIKEWWVDNIVSPFRNNIYTCRWFRFQQGSHDGMAISGNNYDKLSSVFSSSTGGLSTYIQPKRTLRFEYGSPVSNGDEFIPHHLMIDSSFAVIGVRVVLYNYSGEEDVFLQTNSVVTTIKVASANTHQVAVTAYDVRKLFYTVTTSGAFFFRLYTASNKANLQSYSIEIDII